MKVLFPNEERRTTTHSSIDQYHKFIATYERGGWTPIEFDYLDYIDCDKVVSHPVIIEFDDKLGYYFPIGECEYDTDEYILTDRHEIVLEELPDCMGEGFYEAWNKSQDIINFDNGTSLGTHNKYRLRIGQDYYLAEEFLPADDAK